MFALPPSKHSLICSQASGPPEKGCGMSKMLIVKNHLITPQVFHKQKDVETLHVTFLMLLHIPSWKQTLWTCFKKKQSTNPETVDSVHYTEIQYMPHWGLSHTSHVKVRESYLCGCTAPKKQNSDQTSHTSICGVIKVCSTQTLLSKLR